jgi:voltage-dependent anion channel protein 2
LPRAAPASPAPFLTSVFAFDFRFPDAASTAAVKAKFSSGNFKVDNLEVSSNKTLTGEVSLVEALPATKLGFKATDSTREKGAESVSAEISAEYIHKSGVVTVSVDALKYAASATALVNYQGFLVGGAASAKVGGDKGLAVGDYNVLLGYKTKDITTAIATDNKLANGTVAYYQVVRPDITTAAVAKFPLAFAKTDAPVSVEVGAQYALDANTTLNVKVANTGLVGLSYAQVLSPLAKLTVAAQVDGSNIAADSHKLGFTLNLTA